MIIDILTIFPEMFAGVLGESIIKRAQENKHVTINLHNLRDWTTDNHRSVDDRPFGGGAGMIMRVDVIERAIKDLKNAECRIQNTEHKNSSDDSTQPFVHSSFSLQHSKVVLLDTKGKFYNQSHAQHLALECEHLILIVPHYEGVDHRVHEHIADEVFSIGPYVLTGGELPAMVVVDSVVRLLPGVISEESLKEESYATEYTMQNAECRDVTNKDTQVFNHSIIRHSIEYPQYTRPAEYNGWRVPDVLLSGHHGEIEKWRAQQSEKLSKGLSEKLI